MEALVQLPMQLAHDVLICLDTDKILTLWNSSSRLRSVMNNNYFWKMKCRSEHYEEFQDPLKYKTFEKYLTKCLLHWQKVYMCGVLNKQLSYNWENGICKETCIELNTSIREINYFHDEISIGTNYFRNSIILVNSTTGTIKKTLHAGEKITKVIKSENFLIAVLNNSLLKVWDLKNKSLLLVRDFGVSILLKCVHKHRIGIYIATNELVILNVFTNTLDAVIESGICIDFSDDEKFAVGTMDDHVKIFDSSSNILWDFVCCEGNTVTDVTIIKEHLFVFHFGKICFWKIQSQEKLRMVDRVLNLNTYNRLVLINEHTVLLRKRAMLDDDYDYIEGYNFVTGSTIFKIDVDETTYDITANDRYVFGVKKNYIYIWSIKSGCLLNRFKTWKNFTLYHSTNMQLFATKTKLSYLLPHKSLHVLNYEDNIEEINI